jgi:ELWxxDGT repeat protein
MILAVSPAWAGEAPHRLGDLNTTPGSPLFTVPMPPSGFVPLGGRVLFSTADLQSGDEGILWSTDGTAPGTVAVSSSLCPAPCSSIRPLAAWHGLALLQSFLGSEALYARLRLVRTDGTAAGTFPLTGILDNNSFGAALDVHAPPAGPFFYFNACFLASGCAVWRSDGTPAGTVELRGADSLPFLDAHAFAVQRGKLFFVAGHGTSGTGIWSTDGTPEGTVLLGGVQESRDSESRVVATPSHVFFASGDTGQDLWVTEGTPKSTRPLAHFAPVSCTLPPEVFCDTPDVNSMAAFGDAVYFETHRPGHGAEIWRSDGSRPGTHPLIELPAAAGDAFDLQRIGGRWIFLASPGLRAVFWTVDDGFTRAAPLAGCDGGCPGFAGSLAGPGPATWLFTGEDPVHGAEPWITDGTGAGTRRLADACPGECAGIRPVYYLKDAFPAPSGKTYFRAYPREDADYETAGDELWITDGTPAGTHRVAGHFSEVGFAGSLAVFGTLRPENPAYELWRTDGTRSRRIAVLRRFAQGSNPSFAPFQDGVLLLADAENRDTRLWRSDGRPEGTLPLQSFEQGNTQAYASFLPSPGPFQLFEVEHQKGNGGPVRTEVWRTDGSPGGTLRLADLGPDTFLDLSILWDGKLLFDVEDSTSCSFWTSDGTAAGTRKILPPMPGLRCPTAVAELGSRFLFVARAGTDHPIPQVFLSDGTPAGTRQISAVQEERDALADRPVRVGGTVYFRLSGPVYFSPELWQTDGTPAGTRLAFPLTGVDDLTVFRGDLYLTASLPPETGGRGLFQVVLPGGSPALLARVSPRNAGAGTFPPAQLTPAGDRLLFVGQDAEHGTELWVTDGTAGSTRRLRDLQPGPGSSNPDGLTAVGDRVFFSADDGTNGRELWESDGTARGTRRNTDIAPGGFASIPFLGYNVPLPSFVAANGFLFLGADDGVTGVEPWALPLEP